MKGFAKAYGSKPLWYGVQALGSSKAHFVCFYMVNGQIFCFDFGLKETSPTDRVLTLPLPPKIWVSPERTGNDVFIIDFD